MMNKITLFNVDMHPITMDETVDTISQSIEKKQCITHCVVNVAKLVNAQSDTKLRESINQCDLINVDGQGIVLGAKWLGIHIPERVSGIDLMWRLLSEAENKQFRVFFLGAKEEILNAMIGNIQKTFPSLIIAGSHHGYFRGDEERVVKEIEQASADILFIGISSPYKENFIHDYHQKIKIPFIMGVGGSFDVIAGKTKRAPLWMQRFGLEWFYRLLQEPKRMWKRYLFTNMVFFWLLIKAKFA